MKSKIRCLNFIRSWENAYVHVNAANISCFFDFVLTILNDIFLIYFSFTLVILSRGFLIMWPVHLNFVYFSCVIMRSSLMVFRRSLLLILYGQNILHTIHRHLLMNTCIQILSLVTYWPTIIELQFSSNFHYCVET